MGTVISACRLAEVRWFERLGSSRTEPVFVRQEELWRERSYHSFSCQGLSRFRYAQKMRGIQIFNTNHNYILQSYQQRSGKANTRTENNKRQKKTRWNTRSEPYLPPTPIGFLMYGPLPLKGAP